MNTKRIWKEYHQDLKRYIKSIAKDDQVADDLLQEVFIKVHTKIDQLENKEKLKSWLFTIAKNTVMDYFKSLLKTEEIKDEILLLDQEDSRAQNEHDCLSGIINHLPKKYKRPLYLADIKGIKQAAIAHKLSLPLPTIKSQIQRGRKLIVQGYMDCCDYQLNEKGKLIGERKEKGACKMCQ